jgi:hypothetical protein
MALKSGWGGGKGMNGTTTAKSGSSVVKKGFGKARAGTKGAANKGYK